MILSVMERKEVSCIICYPPTVALQQYKIAKRNVLYIHPFYKSYTKTPLQVIHATGVGILLRQLLLTVIVFGIWF
jgi:hypothetical protein